MLQLIYSDVTMLLVTEAAQVIIQKRQAPALDSVLIATYIHLVAKMASNFCFTTLCEYLQNANVCLVFRFMESNNAEIKDSWT